MTTATLAAGNRTMATVVRPRRSLEELVDQLFAAMGFKDETETAEPSPTRSIHEARRLRQAGQAIDGALAVFAGMDMAKATTREARWAYTEWTDLVRRRFGRSDVVVYSQGTGRAAALVPRGDGTLGGRGGPGDALASRQGRLGAQPAGAAAPGEGLPLTGSERGAAWPQPLLSAPSRRSRHVTPRASATRGVRPASTCADDSRRQIAGRSLPTLHGA